MYYNRSDQLFTKAISHTRIGSITQFPITRIFIALLFLIPVSILDNLVNLDTFKSLGEPYFTLVRYLGGIILFSLFLIAYRSYTHYVEKRKAIEFNTKNFLQEFGSGIAISFGIVCIIVLLMFSLGYYRIESLNSPAILADRTIVYILGSFIEELLFRVIIFKLVEEFAGSWIALLIQGLVFGFIHISNENATLLSSLSIIISSAIFFGAAYMLTKRIWLVWGLHFSWNFFQEGIFGMPNPGYQSNGLIKPVLNGPEWKTG